MARNPAPSYARYDRGSRSAGAATNDQNIIDYIREHLDGVGVLVASRETGAQELAWRDIFFIDPVYGGQRWVCILNPSADTFMDLEP